MATLHVYQTVLIEQSSAWSSDHLSSKIVILVKFIHADEPWCFILLQPFQPCRHQLLACTCVGNTEFISLPFALSHRQQVDRGALRNNLVWSLRVLSNIAAELTLENDSIIAGGQSSPAPGSHGMLRHTLQLALRCQCLSAYVCPCAFNIRRWSSSASTRYTARQSEDQ